MALQEDSRDNLPLTGLRVVEFAGLAPGPMVGMILADFGADVVRVDRPRSESIPPVPDVLSRRKRSIAIDSKNPTGHAILKRLINRADILIDPFRPGVMERLNLDPDIFLGDQGSNKRLVYARLVGFPRSGPQKDMAGHDLNYLALSGVLSMFPGEGKPEFPLNILADFAAGGLMCTTGILLALMERNRSDRGQVVNADMVSGTRYLASYPLIVSQLPLIHFGHTQRNTGLLDGGAPFYNVYTCADGRWMSLACLEPRFFRTFLRHFLDALPPSSILDNDNDDDGWRPSAADQHDPSTWPRMRTFFERGFKSRPRDHWAALFQDTDACAVPVLSREEAATLASGTRPIAGRGPQPEGEVVPAPHPVLERTPAVPVAPDARLELPACGAHTNEVLSELSVSDEERAALAREGALDGGSRSKL